MTCSIKAYSIPAGFSRADVINKLEQVFTDLGYHADGISGLVTNVQSFTGGGTGGQMARQQWYDVEQSSTTGTGTGASFWVSRGNAGEVASVKINRPGQGYKTSDKVTIPASSIGGAASGAQDIEVTVSADVSTFGGKTEFFEKDTARSDPWAVLRMENDKTKKYGYTYRGFYLDASNRLIMKVGCSFYPFITNAENYPFSFRGEPQLDTYGAPDAAANSVTTDANVQNMQNERQFATGRGLWSTTSYDLEIVTYTSGLDLNCTLISFHQPGLPTTNLIQNTPFTFSINKYSTPVWDLDEVWMCGFNVFEPISGSTSPREGTTNPNALVNIWCGSPWGPVFWASQEKPGQRAAEYGFFRTAGPPYVSDAMSQSAYQNTQFYLNMGTKYDKYQSNIQFQQTSNGNGATQLYSRLNTVDAAFRFSGKQVDSKANYRAIFKGVPISSKIAPVVYYYPDDLVVVDFLLDQGNQNIQAGDTITVSASEIYTVITGGYSATSTQTWGILLACRTV